MIPSVVLHVLFFLSGISGLIYQVIWVRELGTVFGNTVYSASLVIAIFMLGLGAGSYVMGAWADRRYAQAPESLLRTYAWIELGIGALGFAVTLLLPQLTALIAAGSAYVPDASGWFVLSPLSYGVRGAITVLVLAPITVLMGGTLTLLIRYRVRQDVESAGGWKIAALYAANTAGAAAGAFLTDFALVPSIGLHNTQIVAVVLNLAAGIGAWALLRTRRARAGGRETEAAPSRLLKRAPYDRQVAAVALALALSGFAALGMEILWLRHFQLLLGGFRAVFSLVLTVILVGIGAGSLLGGVLERRTGRPREMLLAVQALFVVTGFAGLTMTAFPELAEQGRALDAILGSLTPAARWRTEVWYDLRPILIELGLPALLMGCAFPLANAVIQRTEQAVGRRAGILYLANTLGAVCGSLVTGYVMLPNAGLQGSAALLMAIAGLTVLPLYWAEERKTAAGSVALAVSALVVVVSVGAWLQLPPLYVIQRALASSPPGERRLELSEGITDVIEVTEVPGLGRGLITNGHPMSSTAPLDQRYMRALAHIPLLAIEQPSRVLVIGFGVGNTTHAATLHPGITRVDVADLSRQVLEHAGLFRDANGGVLQDSRVRVFVNDGRQHLAMQPPATYDLITLEPPPIAHAGVGALYSQDFYALARSRLSRGGYLSQWLPAYQVPAETTLAMVRAFVDVFPQSVLLSGTQAELLLIGTTGDRIEIDPHRLAMRLTASPAVAADLRRVDLGTPTEIVGTFVGSADTLQRASVDAAPVTDDRPLQEYGVRSVIGAGLRGVPASLFDLSAVVTWCPRCFDGEEPAAAAAGLDAYLELMNYAYRAPVPTMPHQATGAGPRRILGSAYLGAVVPESDAVYNVIGVTLLRQGRYAEAVDEFREALRRRPDSADAHRNLATALVETGQASVALDHLRRAVDIDPGNAGAQHELGSLLLARQDYAAAVAHLDAALRAKPDSAAAHNDLGVALASLGNMPQAIEHFQRAVILDAGFEEARRNLEAARRGNGGGRR